MHRTISTICIVTKAEHKEAASLGQKLLEWFKGHNVASRICENGSEEWTRLNQNMVCDLVLVLGGDGTLLSVARHLVGTNIPLVGINMGKVGFLAEISSNAWKERLSAIINGDVVYKRRLALSCTVERDGKPVFYGVAANDFVISRGALARVIKLDISVNGHSMGPVRADGMIIASPSGSTGYAISAGGPLLHPDMDAYSITPVCPFLRSFYPMVVPGEHVMTANVTTHDADIYVTLDGQEGTHMQSGDTIAIARAEGGLLYAEFNDNSYYTKLLSRGFVGESC